VLFKSTPYKVYFGMNHLLSHPKVFGYDAFVHVHNEKRNDLDKKLFKCIFIGYRDGMK
jgi:hypothetical protein